jgi:hypothetical protein
MFITGVHGCIMSRESNASGRGHDAMDAATEAVLARWLTYTRQIARLSNELNLFKLIFG